ncbi:MAG TPA: AAA family ATPase [Ktedonobacteraceae bacterium]|nr:AAA family ATPase [Ktedonobacteraceae bacterium]
MSTQATTRWDTANQRYLLAALALVRHALEDQQARQQQLAHTSQATRLRQELAEAEQALPAPATLTRLCTAFNLSPFERDILLLCAGIELDSSFRQLCAQLAGQGSVEQTTSGATLALPTFSLALAVLADAHWDALTPYAPLRHWRLITIRPGATLSLSPLRIDEAILHYLAGLPYQDEQLNTLCQIVSPTGELVPSHYLLMQRLLTAWKGQAPASIEETSLPPIIQLCGDDSSSKSAIAAHACQQLNMHLKVLSAEILSGSAGEIEHLARLWERETVLGNSILLLDCDGLDATEKKTRRAVITLLQHIQVPVMISCREHSPWLRLSRPLITLDVESPATGEQRRLWQQELSGLNINLNGQIERLTMQFNLNSAAIRAASAQLLLQKPGEQIDSESQGRLLWETCRLQARPALDNLAQRIEPHASWEDLVLPEAQQQLLQEIVAHVRQRATVYETWGFGGKSTRGLGISALFAGSSGTGKTLAAEVMANALHLDLYRIDLSAIVSKYIGETEKNLRQIFDAAEKGGVILLFDEADALFGKRSEVKDSHDRYANIEVSYLLQRMETYRGLAILTTNLKSSLDTAFLRRIRFVVQFPFPDAPMRAEIWRHIFPQALPTENLDLEKLARLHVAGGNIRNIALHAAFLAADTHEPVRMTHLLRAASTEYAKLEKPLTEAEIGGWIS